MITAHLTPKSGNAKTGPIPVSTVSEDSCPDCCPLKGHGCYGDGGPIRLHWNKVSTGERGISWVDYVSSVSALPDSTLFRHAQVGDFPGDGKRLDRDKCIALAKASKGKSAIAYCHYDMTGEFEGKAIARHYLSVVRAMAKAGLSVNLSGNNPEHAQRLLELDIAPVVTVLPTDHEEKRFAIPGGHPAVVCPATYKDNVTCSTCKLCAVSKVSTQNGVRPRVVIGFPAHGSSKRKASLVASGQHHD